jgi:hypothetical protein
MSMSNIPALFKKACEENNLQVARFCLSSELFKRNTKALQEGLQIASRSGYTEIVKLLLDTKVINKIAEIDNNASLTDAINYRHEEVANLLLKNKQLVKKTSINANSNLEIAIKFRFKFIIESLLKNKQVKDAVVGDANTIIRLMNNGESEYVKLLLDHAFANKKSAVIDILKMAVKDGQTDLVKLLLEKSKVKNKIADNNNAMLIIAMQNWDRELVKSLLTFETVKKTITGNNIENLLRVVIQRGDPEIIKLILASLGDEVKPKFISLMYESSISTLSKMTFVKDNKNGKEGKDLNPVKSNMDEGTVVYNQEGYDLNFSVPPTFQQGNALSGLPPSRDFFAFLNPVLSPIGYNIHLPPPGKEIKNIFVHVYGGGTKRDISTFARLPGELYDFESDLLNQGNAIITLNLPDLIRNSFGQNEMSEDTHNMLHQCINQFHQTVKNKPETLHPSLGILKDKDVFLYGMSFGGRTAIRHAELYPNTFKGYISHDGLLSGEMADSSYLMRGAFNLASHLDPSDENEIKKIKEPVLLMHNMDDNNVNVLVTLDFYQRMAENGQSDLARLCLTSIGSPTSENEALHNRGHFLPANKKDYNRYIETLANFIENGPSALPSIAQWQSYRSQILAAKFYKQGDIHQKFISEVLNKVRLDPDEKLRIKELTKEFMFPEKPQPLWDEHYKPLFYAMHFVDKLAGDKQALKTEIARLDKENLLSDSIINKALAVNANMFTSYLKERFGINVSTDEVVKNDEMIKMFRRLLQSLPTQDPFVTKLVLNALYQADLSQSEPKLLVSHDVEFKNDSQLQDAANQAKDELNNVLSGHRKLISYAWREAAKKSLENDKATNSNPSEITKPHHKKK